MVRNSGYGTTLVMVVLLLGFGTMLIPWRVAAQLEGQEGEGGSVRTPERAQEGGVQITEPPVPPETDVTVERDYWAELHAAAHSCFDGADFRVDLSGGMAARTLGDQAQTGPFGEVKLTVPLYSRGDRQKRKQNRGVFLEHAAGIIGELRAAQAKIRVKREKATVLKSVMLQGGLSGIEAHFRTKEEIVSLDAVIGAAEMKLEGFIKSCLGG